jgi:hypothetical protein
VVAGEAVEPAVGHGDDHFSPMPLLRELSIPLCGIGFTGYQTSRMRFGVSETDRNCAATGLRAILGHIKVQMRKPGIP